MIIIIVKMLKMMVKKKNGLFKRTMIKRKGKVLNDDYIKYQNLTTKLVEDEDEIINYHMNII